MDNHPIENLMKSTMENIKNMIDVDTVIGNPVTAPDGTTIIPISKVSFGFASGGSEFKNSVGDASTRHPFAGGSGAGISLKPVGFLVCHGNNIRFLSVNETNPYDKLLDVVPQAIDMVSEFLHKDDALSTEIYNPCYPCD
ncbi:MAG: GerW family sporulation protein [Clostridium sp.]|uniref:GerW family sporulation protein n=1 Tax=Clostridium sp. TaxID=1506 RepID=UPI00305DF521